MFRKFNKSYELKVERSPIHHPYEEKSGTFLNVCGLWVVIAVSAKTTLAWAVVTGRTQRNSL